MFYSSFPVLMGLCNYVATWVNRGARTQGKFSTIKEITKYISNGHANDIPVILNSLLRIQAENLMSDKPNKQRPVISKCSTQQTNVTAGTGNQTETEKQGCVFK